MGYICEKSNNEHPEVERQLEINSPNVNSRVYPYKRDIENIGVNIPPGAPVHQGNYQEIFDHIKKLIEGKTRGKWI